MIDKYKLSDEELQKIRKVDFGRQPGFIPAESILGKEIGVVGSAKRADFDAKARAWYYGEVLRDYRKSLGMTQKELADKIGKERTYINRIEQGKTDMQLSSFLSITSALGINVHLG